MICIPICHSTPIMNSFFVETILKKLVGNEELCVTHLLFRKCFSGEKIYIISGDTFLSVTLNLIYLVTSKN